MGTLLLELHHKHLLLFLILVHPTSGYHPINAPYWILPAVSCVYVCACAICEYKIIVHFLTHSLYGPTKSSSVGQIYCIF